MSKVTKGHLAFGYFFTNGIKHLKLTKVYFMCYFCWEAKKMKKYKEEEEIEESKAEEPITEYGQLDENGFYTYWDYMKWKFTDRVELIKGRIRKMSPGPNRMHQEVSRDLTKNFFKCMEKAPCSFYIAPFDVRLPIPSAKKDTTVVQPDLCIVCDETKLDKQGCNGAPDLVVEILSPGNTSYEMNTKFQLYEEAGVKEYWILQMNKVVLVYYLEKDKFIGLSPVTSGEMVQSKVFSELKVPVDEVFARVDS